MRTVIAVPSAVGGAGATGNAQVPCGEFTTGSDTFDPEQRTADRAALDSFWMDTRPATAADFRQFVTATGYRTIPEQPPRADDNSEADPELLVARSLVFRRAGAPNYSERYRLAARQDDAVHTSAGHFGFRCVIRSGPLLARPGPRPAPQQSFNRADYGADNTVAAFAARLPDATEPDDSVPISSPLSIRPSSMLTARCGPSARWADGGGSRGA